MQTIDLEGNGRIRVERTEIDVRYRGKVATFVLPIDGPDHHAQVMERIDLQELLRPTTSQSLSLVDLAMQNPNEKHCVEVLNRFTKSYLWTATESLSFSDEVFVYDNIKGEMPLNRSDLLELSRQREERVRLIKKGFKTGLMSIEEALVNPYVIAQIGENMLPIFERVAKRLNESEVYVFGSSSTRQDVKTYTSLFVYDHKLDLDGSCHGKDKNGYAYGVAV